MLAPPVPSPAVMSPPCIINSSIIRWNGESLYVNGFVADGGVKEEVHIARKLPLRSVTRLKLGGTIPLKRAKYKMTYFLHVLGVLSLKSSIVILPNSSEPLCTSRKTLGRTAIFGVCSKGKRGSQYGLNHRHGEAKMKWLLSQCKYHNFYHILQITTKLLI